MLAAAVLVAAAVAGAPIPPAPAHHAEDHAGFVSPQTLAAVDAKLAAYEAQTGHQVVVWIGTTLGGAPLDDWAVRTFAQWKLGRAGHDDGLAMFVLADDRQVDIEVGYGLESRVPDATAARIIRDVVTPKLRAGDRDGAIIAGVDATLAAIEGTAWTAPTASPAPPEVPWTTWVFGGILAVIALLVLWRHPVLGWWLLSSALGGGGKDRGGSGGGFHGGGGRSGGGGARGGW